MKQGKKSLLVTHRVRNNAAEKFQVLFATMLNRKNEILQTKLENT